MIISGLKLFCLWEPYGCGITYILKYINEVIRLCVETDFYYSVFPGVGCARKDPPQLKIPHAPWPHLVGTDSLWAVPGCGGAAEQHIKVPCYFLRCTERLDAGLAAQTMTDIKRKWGVAENKLQKLGRDPHPNSSFWGSQELVTWLSQCDPNGPIKMKLSQEQVTEVHSKKNWADFCSHTY